MNMVIEMQGQQHYYPIDFACKGEKWAYNSFIENQKRDQIKQDYCKNKCIKLLEITYRDFKNIETILERELSLLQGKEV